MTVSTPVVDAQCTCGCPRPPTGRGRPAARNARAVHRPEPISGPALLREMRAAGVDRAVLVPPFFKGYRNDRDRDRNRDRNRNRDRGPGGPPGHGPGGPAHR